MRKFLKIPTHSHIVFRSLSRLERFRPIIIIYINTEKLNGTFLSVSFPSWAAKHRAVTIHKFVFINTSRPFFAVVVIL
jgi:hypothetical protein